MGWAIEDLTIHTEAVLTLQGISCMGASTSLPHAQAASPHASAMLCSMHLK